jgi:hypothetical protein
MHESMAHPIITEDAIAEEIIIHNGATLVATSAWEMIIRPCNNRVMPEVEKSIAKKYSRVNRF